MQRAEEHTLLLHVRKSCPVIMVRRSIFGVFLLLICVIVAGRSHGQRHRNRHRQVSGSKEFDMLIFTQQWPQTVCFTWKKISPRHKCSLPDNEEWSIHGIWPTKNHEIGPFYCNRSMPFDIKALQSIELKLDTEWMDIHKGKKGHELWIHEWEKHGTCAAILEPLNSEFKYFSKGIELLEKYDMKKVLGDVGITPGGMYKIQKILDAIQSQVHKKVQVQCIVNPINKESYLSEVRICFDKKMEMMDCNNAVGFPTNCKHDADVIYPGTVPSVVLI